MTDFEDRLTDYLVMLKQNKLIYSIFDAKEGESRRVLLFPKDEEELARAIDAYTFLDDFAHLTFDIRLGDINPIPVEENTAFALCIDIINNLKNNRPLAPIQDDDKNVAKLMYDCAVGFFSEESQEDAIRYMSEQTGFDLNNEKESELFYYYLDKAKDLIPSSPSDEEDNKTSEIGKYFHELYVNGKKNGNDNDLGKAILRLLMNL